MHEDELHGLPFPAAPGDVFDDRGEDGVAVVQQGALHEDGIESARLDMAGDGQRGVGAESRPLAQCNQRAPQFYAVVAVHLQQPGCSSTDRRQSDDDRAS